MRRPGPDRPARWSGRSGPRRRRRGQCGTSRSSTAPPARDWASCHSRSRRARNALASPPLGGGAVVGQGLIKRCSSGPATLILANMGNSTPEVRAAKARRSRRSLQAPARGNCWRESLARRSRGRGRSRTASPGPHTAGSARTWTPTLTTSATLPA